MCQVNIISLEKDVRNCYVSIILSELTTEKTTLKGLGDRTKIWHRVYTHFVQKFQINILKEVTQAEREVLRSL